MRLAPWFESFWYKKHPVRWVLWPLAGLFQAAGVLRRCYWQRLRRPKSPVPVIVVGNLTPGGAGKTPLVIALVQRLQQRGLRVGVVSRGYGAAKGPFPREVSAADSAPWAGDEPLLIVRKTGCPLVIDPNRPRAVRCLLQRFDCQVVISDDGLQHYAMDRAMEIVVMDGWRGLGNGLCLPAGPLRESPRRLEQVDLVVVHGGQSDAAFSMTLVPGPMICLSNGETCSMDQLPQPVAAVAGIGHPPRFFDSLRELGLSFQPYPFADHHAFRPEDLSFPEAVTVMTEKDAVKCQPFATERLFYLPVEACLNEAFWTAFWPLLDTILKDRGEHAH